MGVVLGVGGGEGSGGHVRGGGERGGMEEMGILLIGVSAPDAPIKNGPPPHSHTVRAQYQVQLYFHQDLWLTKGGRVASLVLSCITCLSFCLPHRERTKRLGQQGQWYLRVQDLAPGFERNG